MPSKPFAFSAKAVIKDAQGRFLLLRRSASSKHNAGKWDLPGGKADVGEDLDQALIREVSQETTFTVRLERVLGAAESETPVKKIAYLIFEAHFESGEICLSDEHDAYAWVSPSRLDEYDICPQFRQFLKERIAGGGL
jgi:8-oxo-dGTP diphosphatase